MKKRNGITLMALAITIIIMLILAGIVLGTFMSQGGGILGKTKESNFTNAVSEMYERADSELSYLKISNRIRLTGGVTSERLYASKGFKDYYEIRGEYIYDKSRKMDLVKKQDFEIYVENKLNSEGTDNVTEKPSVIAVTNEDTAIRGTGKIGSDIIVKIGTNTYTGKVGSNGEFSIPIPKQTSGTTITIVQKEEGKKESEEISLEVYKTRLEKIEIDKVVNTDTKVTGKAKPGADVKLVISRKRIYRKSK